MALWSSLTPWECTRIRGPQTMARWILGLPNRSIWSRIAHDEKEPGGPRHPRALPNRMRAMRRGVESRPRIPLTKMDIARILTRGFTSATMSNGWNIDWGTGYRARTLAKHNSTNRRAHHRKVVRSPLWKLHLSQRRKYEPANPHMTLAAVSWGAHSRSKPTQRQLRPATKARLRRAAIGV